MQQEISESDPGRGFTLIELLVVIAAIALLAGLLLPAMSKAKEKARTIECLARKQQFGVAWALYSVDNNEKFVLNPDHGYSDIENQIQGWTFNVMGWDLDEQITNRQRLLDPRFNALGPYTGYDTKIYRCPSDRYLSPVQKAAGWAERPRSIAMNMMLGDGPTSDRFFPTKKHNLFLKAYYHTSDFLAKNPAEIFVVMDEHPESIRTGVFSYAVLPPPEQAQYPDIPGSHHNRGATMNFADGHAELKKWVSPIADYPILYGNYDIAKTRTRDRRDYEWIVRHATELKRGDWLP